MYIQKVYSILGPHLGIVPRENKRIFLAFPSEKTCAAIIKCVKYGSFKKMVGAEFFSFENTIFRELISKLAASAFF